MYGELQVSSARAEPPPNQLAAATTSAAAVIPTVRVPIIDVFSLSGSSCSDPLHASLTLVSVVRRGKREYA
jgi:hypothetical protein